MIFVKLYSLLGINIYYFCQTFFASGVVFKRLSPGCGIIRVTAKSYCYISYIYIYCLYMYKKTYESYGRGGVKVVV